MVRQAAVMAALFGVLASNVQAGQASVSFQVGVTVVGAKKHAAAGRPVARTYTWGAAAVSVKLAGFAAPRRAERSDKLYWFIARKGLGRFRVAVSIASGAIVKVIPT